MIPVARYLSWGAAGCRMSEQALSKDEFLRFEQGLREARKAREAHVDGQLHDLRARVEHKAANIKQEALLRFECIEDSLRRLEAGDRGVPVLRVKIDRLEEELDRMNQQVDELRMSAAKFMGIVLASAPIAGVVAWLLERVIK